MMVPDLEIYSIDEAFLRLDNIAFDDIINLCSKIRFNINKWLGIPTSIGIAGTKTLAKIANQIAKKNLYNLAPNHLCDLRDENLQIKVLAQTAVQDVWGIGKGIATKLKTLGIENALQLREADSKQIRKILGVVGERIVYELNGISCLHLEEIAPRKNILSSKSFGKNVSAKSDLQEAVANYAVRACEKMRQQKTLAQAIHVYIRTNPFSSKPQYCGAGSISFAAPTDNVVEIIKSALKILEQIYQKNYEYKKAGIMLLDLVKKGENEQINLFQNDLLSNQNVKNFDDKKSEIIQKTLEKINQNFSKNTIFYAIQGTKRSWQMLCNKRSQHYTTNIKEIAKVY
jgi:DNA polymerase V